MKKLLNVLTLFVLGAMLQGVQGQENIASNAAPVFRLNLAAPLDYQVTQRSTLAGGTIIVAGNSVAGAKYGPLPEQLEARVIGRSSSGDLPGVWQSLPCDARVAAFRGELNLPSGGWYRLEARALYHGQPVAEAVVEHVGMGEIFVIAGQSNAANYGEEKHATRTGLVASFDGTQWQPARDPMPGAGGKKGSFMPLFGDAMAERFHVPIGLIAMGIGSTSVREWLPAGTRLSHLPPLTHNVVTVGAGQWEPVGAIFENFSARMKQLGTNGFRAVLWHQGESDANQADGSRTLPGQLYRQYLEQLIRDSRAVIGWDAPWFVASVSYHNAADSSSPDLRAAQKAVCDDGLALPGADTDTLTGEMREKQGAGIHLSAKGLQAHADLWVKQVGPWLEQQLKK
jgi:hypothetical protein